MLKVAIQLSSFLVICVFSGIAFTKLGFNFYLGVIVGGAIQYIFTYAINSFIQTYASLKNKELENERIKQFSLQGMEVECPCSKKVKDFVPIILNTQNKYKCKECQKLISVYIAPTTALVTEPLINTDITDPKIIENNEL